MTAKLDVVVSHRRGGMWRITISVEGRVGHGEGHGVGQAFKAAYQEAMAKP